MRKPVRQPIAERDYLWGGKPHGGSRRDHHAGVQEQPPPPTKESITELLKAGFRARGRNKRMTGAGNLEHAETVGLELSITSVDCRFLGVWLLFRYQQNECR